MKKILLILSFIFTLVLSSQATHIAGGDINYRYIGDSTGVPHQYEITMRIYRECNGATHISSSILVSSSCFAQQSITLVPDSTSTGQIEVPSPTFNDCVTPNTVICLGLRVYRGVATLPGKCIDFTFEYTDCCRPNNIDNLPNSNTQYFHFATTLNNMVKNNSSAYIANEPVRAFCVGNNFTWDQSATDLDGDSIYYELTTAKGQNGAPLPYANGYSYKQPITTNPAGSFYLDSLTGIMNFTPGAIESAVVAISVLEYRLDSATNQMTLVGSQQREMLVAVSYDCTALAKMGVQYDYNAPGLYPDPVNGLPTKMVDCNDSILTVNFISNINCASISADGSDFRFADSAGVPIPIHRVEGICDSTNQALILKINLANSFPYNGKFVMYSKTGSDGNTLLNTCGFAMDEFDTLQFVVENCSGIGVDQFALENKMFLPTVYSPNGDGQNDRLVFQMPENLSGEFNFVLRNSLGQLVYQEKCLNPLQWEVNLHQASVKTGMYFYTISFKSNTQGANAFWRSALSIYR